MKFRFGDVFLVTQAGDLSASYVRFTHYIHINTYIYIYIHISYIHIYRHIFIYIHGIYMDLSLKRPPKNGPKQLTSADALRMWIFGA